MATGKWGPWEIKKASRWCWWVGSRLVCIGKEWLPKKPQG